MSEPTESSDTRARILAATFELLTSGGRDAVTTRAVAAAANVQAPTIYRLFGDKHGLLDAVAEHGFAAYLRDKSVRPAGPDPVEDLRVGWDLHVEFGLANPAIYALMIDPFSGVTSPAAAAGRKVLEHHIHRIAVAGRLRVDERHATDLVHAAGSGTILTLIATPEAERDLGLSHSAREAVIAAITTGKPAVRKSTPATAAIALRAVLDDATALTPGERLLLDEWLKRLASTR
ncbi:TetR/AcrR family transcriptional regulator [Nannocystaceae bacterium ST9]